MDYVQIACRIFDTTEDLLTVGQVRAAKRGVYYALYGGRPGEHNLPVSASLFVDPTGYLKRLQDAARLFSQGRVLADICDFEVTPEAVLAIAKVDRLPLPSLNDMAEGM